MTTLIKKKAARTPMDPWGSVLGSLTTGVDPKALRASATSDVTAQINAAAAANAAAVAGQKIQYANQAKRATGFASALANLTKPDTAAIADQYRQSADRLRGFGTGLTGAVAEAQQAQAEKNAADVARVTGGLGSVASYDIPNMRNVAQMLGVVLPATSLEERALNSISAANATRASQMGGIGSIAQEYMQRGSDLDAEVAAKNAALQAQRPSLFNEALKAAQENARSNIATSIQSRYLVDSLRKSGADITGIDPYTGEPTAQTKAQTAATKAAAKVAREKNIPVFDSTNSNSLHYQADQFGNPLGGKITPLPGYKVDSLGTGVVKTAKPVTLTADARRSLGKDLTTWTETTAPKRIRNPDTGGFMNVPGTGSKPLPYNEVVQKLMTSYGVSRKTAEGYVNQKYRVGEFGRPYPVPPPKGTLPVSATEVTDRNGTVYKLAKGRWTLVGNVPSPAGTVINDANGNPYMWNGRTWVKQ